VVEYYENFAEHAFENTTQSVYSHCVLLKPSGAPIPTTFCFSIRRDIYDLPSIVIGKLDSSLMHTSTESTFSRTMATPTIIGIFEGLEIYD
jgi:hypothetical protein